MAEIKSEVASEATVRTVKFRVRRYLPDKSPESRFDQYEIPVPRGMTVLDGLIWLKENKDPTLSFRYSCRMGICGSCGMFINGFPRLGCQTQILDLECDTITVEPLPNYPNIRDIVPDLDRLFEKHRALRPYIVREGVNEAVEPARELGQTPEELNRYFQFTYCIKCGLCYAACPTTSTDRNFYGPQALGQAFRYSADSRDEGFDERRRLFSSPHGGFRCHFAGACSEACPKGVDPAFAIQLMKREVVLRTFRLKRKPPPAKEMSPMEPKQHNYPKAPEPTIVK